jgi:hypothetical protein
MFRIQKRLDSVKSAGCIKNDTNSKQNAGNIKRDIVRFAYCIKSTV